MSIAKRAIAVALLMLPAALVHSENTSRGIAVISNTLGGAVAAYSNETNRSRIDCDPSGDGRWICASYENPTLADFGSNPVSPPVTAAPANPVPVANVPSNGRVAVVGSNVAEARASLMRLINQRSVDCDPSGDGRWVCANFNNPTLSDVGGAISAPTPPNPLTPVTPTPVTPTPVTPPPTNARVAVVATSLTDARANLARAGAGSAVDCDPSGDGRWICANFNNPTLSDVGGNSAPDAPISPPSNPTPNRPAPTNAREAIPADATYRLGDLILMQYDSCPDPDDLHAAVSGRMVLDHFGLVNGRDYIVSNGTCGAERSRNDYIVRSPEVFNKLYGQSWNDAFNDEANSIVRVAEAVKNALNAGRRVYVMDGGPMDYTSRIVRQVEADGVGDLKRISVYQHSSGWNRRFTGDANLAYLLSRVTYVEVPNGNLRDNGSAQLNMQNPGNSRYPAVNAGLVNRFRNNSVYGADWRVAFSVFNPNNRFDGSDTVELLWLLGLRSNDINNWFDFANRFLPSSGSTPTPVTPQPVAPPTPAAPGGNVIRFEAESANLGSGWVRDTARSGFSGAGYIRWNGGNQYTNPGLGVTRYNFSVTTTGVYRLRIRARAISPPRGDLNNDSWFKMNGQNVTSANFTQWTKVFTTGRDNWQTGGTADFDNDEPFRQRLEAGRSYVLELSGRSQNHAIDTIELVRQ